MDRKLDPATTAALSALPQELQNVAAAWFERFADVYDGAPIPNDRLTTLARLVAASDFAARTLLQDWSCLGGSEVDLRIPPDPDELATFVGEIAASDDPIDTVKRRLRRFRNRYLVRLLWREIEGSARLDETLGGLSDLADGLLDAAAQRAARLTRERFGVIRNESGDDVSIVILGMGKLGGRELNFSSDIDLIFLYPGGQDSDGDRQLSPAEYFTRLTRTIVALLDEVTADGFVFRIDTRLRPFGDSGPPVVSFAALEAYLLQHGRGWERYAYVKARVVGPAPPDAVVRELYEDLITPFVYRRYLDFGVFESLRDMHSMIAAEVARRELANNIKLGPGGIREIEFLVQSLQLVRGGSRPELQGRDLQVMVRRLAGHRDISDADAACLLDAYRFLRRVENFIQAMRDQQVHELPTNAEDRLRLCLAMQYKSWDELLVDLQRHRGAVTEQFERIAFRQQDDATRGRLARRLAALWDSTANSGDWAAALVEENYARAEDLADIIVNFATARATQQIDDTSKQRLREFMPRLLAMIRGSAEPLPALQRTLAIVDRILRRSAYIALLNENLAAMERLVSLCERSAYIAEQIAMFPVLLDELLDPRINSARITRAELDNELRQRLAAGRADDSEAEIEILCQFQRASHFRIAVADYYGSLPIMRVSDSLTDLAETVLNHALQVAWRDMTQRHGIPQFRSDGITRRAGFGIIAYGKLGGIELSYGSDLDLVFLHDSHGDKQITSGDRPIDNTMFFTRLVRRLVHFVTTQTSSGDLYEIDMRLRPDGRSGLLVSSIDAFEHYQEENAWTWEHQALLRARPVAGSAVIAREFERVRADTLTARVRRDTLRNDVVSMRRRMRRELDRSDGQHFDLKQGSGGVADIEFVVQYLVLASAGERLSVIHYPDNIRQLATLSAAGCLDPGSAARLQAIYKTYRLRLHHLALDENQQLVNDDEFREERTFVERIWSELLGA